MATQTELEDLVVEIVGKANKYIQMLEESSTKTNEAGKKIEDTIEKTTDTVASSLNRVGSSVNVYAQQINIASNSINKLSDKNKTTETTTSSLSQKIEKLGKSLHNIGSDANDAGEALGKLTSGLTFWESFNGFEQQEKSLISLKASLESNGREAEDLLDTYTRFADKIEETTTHQGSNIIELLKLAEGMDVTGEAAIRATRNAIALADAQGRTAESVIRATVALEKGNSKAIGEYLPGLRAITDQSERVVEAQRLLGNMYGVVEKITTTTSGKIQQLSNSWSKFKDAVGEVISNGLSPLVSFLQKVVDVFNSFPDTVKYSVAIVLTLLGGLGALTAVVGTGILAFNTLITTIGVYITKAKLAIAVSYLWKTALIGGVVYALYEVVRSATGATQALNDLNNAMETSKNLSDRMSSKFAEDTRKTLQEASNIQNKLARKAVLSEQLEKAKIELRGYVNGVKIAEGEVEALNTRWNRLVGNKILEVANKELAEHRNRLELARDRVNALQQAYNNIRLPEQDEEIIKAIEKLNEELELERKTLGMTSDQLKIFKIELMGATNEMLRASKASVELNRTLSEFSKIANSAESIMRSFNDTKVNLSIDMVGLSDAEKQIKNLDYLINQMRDNLVNRSMNLGFERGFILDENAIKGVQNRIDLLHRQIGALKNDIQPPLNLTLPQTEKELSERTVQLEKMRKVYEDINPLLLQFSKATTFRLLADKEAEQIKIGEKRNQLLSEATEITKQYQTPLEQYADTVHRLNMLLDSGAITNSTFTRAMDDANKKLKDAENSARGARQELEKFNSVLFNSAEAQSRIREFRDTIDSQVKDYKNQINIVPPTINRTPVETEAIKQLRGYFDKRMLVQPQVPNDPQSVITPNRNMNVTANADRTLMEDREQSIKLLKSIDSSLNAIKDKPTSILGLADINT